jgi:hypothetical protein
LRLRTREQALREAQRIVARYSSGSRDLVAELIAERREEAALESGRHCWRRFHDPRGAEDRPFSNFGPQRLVDATISAVNLCGVLTKLHDLVPRCRS